MSQFTGGFDNPNDYSINELEVISLHERQDLSFGVHDVIARNLEHFGRAGVHTADYYGSLDDFLFDVAYSLDGLPTRASGNYIDFNALVLGSRVVGCVEVATINDDTNYMYFDEAQLREVAEYDPEPEVLPEDEEDSDIYASTRFLHGYVDIEGGFSNRGIMSKAAEIVISRLFTSPDIDTVFAIAHNSNRVGERTIEKAGLEKADAPQYMRMRGLKKYILKKDN